MNAAARSTRSRHAERGVVLIVTLLVMVVMLISAAALMRSFDITLGSAGNLAFKRDLAQQSELAAETVLKKFRPGQALYDATARSASNAALNYSAVVLPSDPQGIPNDLLLTNAAFDAKYTAPIIDLGEGRGIKLRYVIDRMCMVAGLDRTLGASQCTLSEASVPLGGTSSDPRRSEFDSSGGNGAVVQPVVYRLSIRADGPRATQSFFQTTFSCCDN